MGFKLTKAERAELDDLRQELAARRAVVEQEFRQFVAGLGGMTSILNGTIDRYNSTASRFRAFADRIGSEHRDAYDERTERWQESDAGTDALAFVEAWEDVEAPDVDPVVVLAPDPPTFGDTKLIDDLPTEAA